MWKISPILGVRVQEQLCRHDVEVGSGYLDSDDRAHSCGRDQQRARLKLLNFEFQRLREL